MNNKGTILIVDDAPSSIKLLTYFLKAEGYTVHPADSGVLALASVAANPPDLILLDIRMPGMDGFEVLRRLKARPESQHIPVIIISADTEMEQQVAGLKLGAVDFISKPYQREELLARVQTHLELGQLRDRLEQNEERLRSLLEAMSEGFSIQEVICDDKGKPCDLRFVEANPAFERQSGLKNADSLGHTLLELFPQSESLWIERFGKVGLTGEPAHFEAMFGPLNKVYQVNAFQIALGRFGVVFTDITGRKQAEIVLAEERNLLATLLDNIPDMIYFKDAQSRIIRSNQAHARRVGMNDPAQMIGKTDFDLFAEEHAREAYEDEQAIMRTGQPLVDKEEKETFLDGHALWVSTTKMPRRDQQGRIIGTFGISRDITERILAAEALRGSEDRYHRLVETLPIGVIIHSQGRIVFANLASAKTIGAANPAELIGKPVIEFVHPDYREPALKRIRQSFSESVPAPAVEEKFMRLDGTPIDVQVTAIPFSDAGKPAMLTIFNDITARKQGEKLQDAIYRISQAADHAKNLDSLYPSIHAIIQEVMAAGNFYIALYDKKNDLLSFPYSVDERDPLISPRKPGKGLTEYVLRTGKTVLCDEALYQGLIQRAEIALVGAYSPIWLGAPLIVEGKAIGVIVVQDYKNAQAYGERELHMLEFVSTQVALAIKRKRLEEEIRSLSLTDELTGLYNRRGFTLLAEQEVKKAFRIKKSMLLLFGDVDYFKTINDTWGHTQGDLALQEVSAILKESLREADILARISGDEFVVLAVDASKESAEIMTNRIQAALEARNQQKDKTYHLTFSMGVALYDPKAPCTVSELIAQADALMYEQKQARR
jgi:diguanylate cyclase (GGDEF)-like protein/PAS domain S-box-containing protein